MRALTAIYRKEVMAYFHSPVAYVLMVGFTLITGYFYFTGVAFYSVASMQAMQNPMFMKLNLQDMLVAPLMGNMSIIMMLISPLLTMRLLAEEKRTGTLELLLSYPLGDVTVVLAKYLAAVSMLALILAPTLLQVLLLAWVGQPHWPAVLSGYLGLLLEGGAFIALGLLASAATENQIVAAVTGFAALLLLWVLGWSQGVVGSEVGAVLKHLSLSSHFEGFPKGLINTSDLAYYLLFVLVFLFITIRTLEAKRWKA